MSLNINTNTKRIFDINIIEERKSISDKETRSQIQTSKSIDEVKSRKRDVVENIANNTDFYVFPNTDVYDGGELRIETNLIKKKRIEEVFGNEAGNEIFQKFMAEVDLERSPELKLGREYSVKDSNPSYSEDFKTILPIMEIETDFKKNKIFKESKSSLETAKSWRSMIRNEEDFSDYKNKLKSTMMWTEDQSKSMNYMLSKFWFDITGNHCENLYSTKQLNSYFIVFQKNCGKMNDSMISLFLSYFLDVKVYCPSLKVFKFCLSAVCRSYEISTYVHRELFLFDNACLLPSINDLMMNKDNKKMRSTIMLFMSETFDKTRMSENLQMLIDLENNNLLYYYKGKKVLRLKVKSFDNKLKEMTTLCIKNTTKIEGIEDEKIDEITNLILDFNDSQQIKDEIKFLEHMEKYEDNIEISNKKRSESLLKDNIIKDKDDELFKLRKEIFNLESNMEKNESLLVERIETLNKNLQSEARMRENREEILRLQILENQGLLKSNNEVCDQMKRIKEVNDKLEKESRDNKERSDFHEDRNVDLTQMLDRLKRRNIELEKILNEMQRSLEQSELEVKKLREEQTLNTQNKQNFPEHFYKYTENGIIERRETTDNVLRTVDNKNNEIVETRLVERNEMYDRLTTRIVKIASEEDIKRAVVTDNLSVLEDLDIDLSNFLLSIKHKAKKVFEKYCKKFNHQSIIKSMKENNRFDFLDHYMKAHEMRLETVLQYYEFANSDILLRYSSFHPGYVGFPNFQEWKSSSNRYASSQMIPDLVKMVKNGETVTDKANNLLRNSGYLSNGFIICFDLCKRGDTKKLKELLANGITEEYNQAMIEAQFKLGELFK